MEHDAQVTQEEAQQAHERERPRAAVIFETIRAEGETEFERSSSALFFSALAAGLSMVFSMIAMGVLRSGLPDTPWRHLVAGFGYTLGFLIVILGRQQLFTENTLTPLLPLIARPTAWRWRQLGRLWAVILAGNLVGAAISSALVAFAGAFPADMLHAFDGMASDTIGHPFAQTFTKAVFAGWLIALMVWLIPLAEGSTPLIIILITYVVAAGEFQHIIAGSVEAMYGAFRGVTTWGEAIGFFVPTLLGNIVGGVAFVAAVSSAEIATERHARKSKTPR